MSISHNNTDNLQKHIDYVFSNNWLIVAGFIILLGAGLATRLALLDWITHPGHGDFAFYYSVAENIVKGQGLQIDYIWNYLSRPETITHASHDFWMPLTSIIISLSLFIFGSSLRVALIPSIAAGLVLSIEAYFLAVKLTDSRFVAFCSAGLVLFMPHLFSRSLLTDSPIYYALFVTASLFFMIRGQENPKRYLFSALFTGLAHLTRQDGILLFITLGLVIIISPLRWKTKFSYTLAASCAYILVLSPLLVSNYRIYGLPFPPGPSKSMFVTEYEDQYSYSKEFTLDSYLDWGTQNIIRSKVLGTMVNAKVISNRYFGTFLKVFIFMGVLMLVSPPNKERRFLNYLPPFIFFIFLFIFYSWVVPISSNGAGFTRSSTSLIPVFIIIAIDTLHRIVPNKFVFMVIFLLISISTFNRSINFTRAELGENIRIGNEIDKLNRVLIGQIQPREENEIVIMTRDPWEVYHTTKYKAIQIPNDDLDTIYEVALKFRANYILLPAPRKALEEIFTGQEIDERFVLVAEIPDSDMKLFEIKIDD